MKILKVLIVLLVIASCNTVTKEEESTNVQYISQMKERLDSVSFQIDTMISIYKNQFDSVRINSCTQKVIRLRNDYGAILDSAYAAVESKRITYDEYMDVIDSVKDYTLQKLGPKYRILDSLKMAAQPVGTSL